jgi:hypothetical protein
MLVLTAIAASPLAAAPAFARGDSGEGWNLWNHFVEWCGTGGGNHGGHGGGTPLPGPGALGLVFVGLGTAVLFARRRQPVRNQ